MCEKSLELVQTDNPRSQPEQFLTVKEASAALGVPEWTLRRSVKRGLFPAYYFGTNRARIRLSEILEVVERLNR